MRAQTIRTSAALAVAFLPAAAGLLAGCIGNGPEHPSLDPEVSLAYTVTPTDDSVTYRVMLPLLLRGDSTRPLVSNLSLEAGTAAWTVEFSLRGQVLVIEGRGPICVATGLTRDAARPFRHDTTLKWTLESTPYAPYDNRRQRVRFADAAPPISMNITASFDEGGGACFRYDRMAGTLQANSTWQAFFVDNETIGA